MKTTRLSSIDFSKMKKLENVISSESTLYIKKTKLLKIYRDLYYCELKKKEQKLEELNKIGKIASVIIPDEKIISNDGIIAGCVMQYKKDAIPLYDYKKKHSSFDQYFKIVKDVTATTKTIHEKGIVIADLNFDNIIFDKNMNHYFVDLDSCSISKITWERLSSLLLGFLNYKNIKVTKSIINTNMDRLSLLLSFLYVIFDTPIQYVPINKYDELSEQIILLKDIRKILIDLISKNEAISEIPYIGDYINTNNNLQLKISKHSKKHNKYLQ